MESSVQYGNSEIRYNVCFSGQKTLRITVTPNQRVTVNAPYDTLTEQIEEKIQKRAAWILRQQAYFRSFGSPTPPRRYVSGESHFYLGRQYRITVVEGKKNEVSFKGRNFRIECRQTEKAGELMKKWYRERAKLKFAEIAEPLIIRFGKYKVEPCSLYIRHMESRWGSCSPSGTITLNTELIKAPRPCIEYVILHELCHLIHPRHTKAFYDLLTWEMPEWQRWKNRLEKLLY